MKRTRRLPKKLHDHLRIIFALIFVDRQYIKFLRDIIAFLREHHDSHGILDAQMSTSTEIVVWVSLSKDDEARSQTIVEEIQQLIVSRFMVKPLIKPRNLVIEYNFVPTLKVYRPDVRITITTSRVDNDLSNVARIITSCQRLTIDVTDGVSGDFFLAMMARCDNIRFCVSLDKVKSSDTPQLTEIAEIFNRHAIAKDVFSCQDELIDRGLI